MYISFSKFFSDPKILGEWTNEGSCTATGEDSACGPGIQIQTRTCTNGTIDTCTDEEIQRNATCEEAGTALPNCRKLLLLPSS